MTECHLHLQPNHCVEVSGNVMLISSRPSSSGGTHVVAPVQAEAGQAPHHSGGDAQRGFCEIVFGEGGGSGPQHQDGAKSAPAGVESQRLESDSDYRSRIATFLRSYIDIVYMQSGSVLDNTGNFLHFPRRSVDATSKPPST